MALYVRVLGAPTVERDGEALPVPGDRAGSALGLLALRAGTVVGAGDLVDAVWGESSPANEVNALQALVSRLRRLFPDSVLVRQGGGYRLDVQPTMVDAAVFADAVERGAAANRKGDPERAARLLSAALEEWRGPLLGGAGATGPLAVEAVRMAELHEVALEELIDSQLGRGRHEDVTGEIERLVADQPLRERRWGQLILALYRSGRQADALRKYQSLRELLAEELGIQPSRPLVELEMAVLEQDPQLEWRPATTEASRPRNIPPPPDVVGREDETKQVLAALAGHRLVTIVGPGGAGKTTLARAATAVLPDDVASDGVFATDLAPAASLTEARALVAAALPGAEGAAPAERIDALRSADALVVLDGCEHLGPASAELAAELLEAGPRVRVLLTTRSRRSIPPGTPPAATIALEGLDLSDAAKLFRRRASTAGGDVTADDEAVTSLVAALDRLPLAVELAAARAPYLSVDEIHRRLDDRLRLLHVPAAIPGSERHQSLAAVLDASHALLGEDAAAVYRRLSVFPASFTADGAEAVAGRDLAPGAAIDALVELIDHSLLSVQAGPGGPRYRFLDTMRAHAAAKLGLAGEQEVATTALVGYSCDWVARAAPEFEGPDEVRWMAAADLEAETLRAALHAAPVPIRAQMALGLWPWWDSRGRRAEGVSYLREAIESGVLDRPATGWAHFALGRLQERTSTERDSEPNTEAALVIAREVGDDGLAARSLSTLAFNRIVEGQPDQARQTVEEAVAAADRSGDVLASIAANNASAYHAYASGRRREAAARWETVVELGRRAGLVGRTGIALGNLGVALDAVGDPGRSLEVLQEAADLNNQAGDRRGATHAALNSVTPLRSLGRTEDAGRIATEALDALLEIGDEAAAIRALSHLAELGLEAGDRLAAHTAALRVTEIARRRGWEVETGLGLRAQGRVAAAYGKLGEAATYYRAALASMPDDSFADTRGVTLAMLGEALLDDGDHDAALAALSEARDLLLSVDQEDVSDIDELIDRARSKRSD